MVSMEARWLFGLVTIIKNQVNMYMIMMNIWFAFMAKNDNEITLNPLWGGYDELYI